MLDINIITIKNCNRLSILTAVYFNLIHVGLMSTTHFGSAWLMMTCLKDTYLIILIMKIVYAIVLLFSIYYKIEKVTCINKNIMYIIYCYVYSVIP